MINAKWKVPRRLTLTFLRRQLVHASCLLTPDCSSCLGSWSTDDKVAESTELAAMLSDSNRVVEKTGNHGL